MFSFLLNLVGIAFLAAGLALSPWGASLLLKFPLSALSAAENVVLLAASLTAAALGAICLWRKQAVGNILLLITVTAIGLAAAEFWLASRPEIGDDPRLQLEKDGKHIVCFPFIEGTQLPEKIRAPRTGKDLLCVAEYPELRKKGYFPSRPHKVLIVGDSFTYGGGVVETDTLGFLLGVAFPRFNFINYGKSGMEITNIHRIMDQALDQNPAVKDVIYFYNINDVLLSGPVGEKQKFINDLEMVRLERINRFTTPIGRWLCKSALFRIANRVLVMRRETDLTIQNYLDSYDPEHNGEALDRTVRELARMDQTARKKGARLTVVMYPLLYKNGRGEYPFVPIHRFMEAACLRSGIPFIDGRHAFAGEKDLRPLMVHPVADYHPNGKANRLMVDLLYKANKVKPLFR